MAETSIRPTKKQRELLSFIEEFIAEHGYSPSYREIMNGMDYTSVATVSLHVGNLIRRGHLRKRDRSARSLEVVKRDGEHTPEGAVTPASGEKWLIGRVETLFAEVEAADNASGQSLDELRTLVGSLKILGLHEAADNFSLRLDALEKKAA